MYSKILVPLDGTTESLAIVRQVCRIYYGSDPELVLVQAACPPPALYVEGDYESPLSVATAHLLRVEERLADLGLRTKVVVRIGSPARVILDVARRERVSLIAMATNGRRGMARFVFGSISESVLRSSPVPVLLVGARTPEPYATIQEGPSIATLLVPVDAGGRSLSILPHAAAVAKLTGARIVLLQVFGTEAGRAPDKAAFARLERASAELHAEGVETHTRVEHGDPTSVILESCRLLRADLIAMATRGRSGIRRWMGGSVTETVLRQAVVPILALRSPGPPASTPPFPERNDVPADAVPQVAAGRGP